MNSLLKKFLAWTETVNKKVLPFIVFSFLVSPILLLSVWRYFDISNSIQTNVFSHRKEVATVLAKTLEERFDDVIDIGTSLVNIKKSELSTIMKGSDWTSANSILITLKKDYPMFERVWLVDKNGVLKADSTGSPELIGSNFSYRDWYKGVSAEWKPYISEIYKSSAYPYYLSIAGAMPIKDDKNNVLGIMAIQIKTTTVASWGDYEKIGPNTDVYFIDKNKHIADGTNLNIDTASAEPLNSDFLLPTKIDTSGVWIGKDPINNILSVVAYQTISKYNWIAVYEEPTTYAYAGDYMNLIKSTVVNSIFIVVTIFIAFIFVNILKILNIYRRKEETLVDSIEDGIVTIDKSWNITLWSKSAEKITGFKSDEVLGKPLREKFKLVRQNDRKENISFIEDSILFGKINYMQNSTLLIVKNGKEIPVMNSAAPTYDEAGNINGAIIIFRDATKERESYTLKTEFAYASHQLQTPVNKAIWILESLIEESTNQNDKEKLEKAYKSLWSVEKMSEEILTVSEINQGMIIPRIAYVKISELFNDVTKKFERNAQEKKIVVTSSVIPPDLNLKTDRIMLARILKELVENGIIYNKVEGYLKIEASLITVGDKKNLYIRISSTGLGIPIEDQALTLTKFFRGRNFDSTEIYGAGLGLYIVESYLNLLGGKIWFDSEEAKETTFHITLPVV